MYVSLTLIIHIPNEYGYLKIQVNLLEIAILDITNFLYQYILVTYEFLGKNFHGKKKIFVTVKFTSLFGCRKKGDWLCIL